MQTISILNSAGSTQAALDIDELFTLTWSFRIDAQDSTTEIVRTPLIARVLSSMAPPQLTVDLSHCIVHSML